MKARLPLLLLSGDLLALVLFTLLGQRQHAVDSGMCQGFLDTVGDSLVSNDKHSPEMGTVLGALIPT